MVNYIYAFIAFIKNSIQTNKNFIKKSFYLEKFA